MNPLSNSDKGEKGITSRVSAVKPPSLPLGAVCFKGKLAEVSLAI
jgi:hypothetical protein